jgi:hypothetical protein
VRAESGWRATKCSRDDVERPEKHWATSTLSAFFLFHVRSDLRLISSSLTRHSAPSTATYHSFIYTHSLADELALAPTLSGRRTSCLPPTALHTRAWLAYPRCIYGTSLVNCCKSSPRLLLRSCSYKSLRSAFFIGLNMVAVTPCPDCQVRASHQRLCRWG